MGRLTVAFLWHMHQPYYVNCAEGRATLPWVRLHALKDYADLPAIARRFPTVHQTFNLVPSLLDQLDDYAADRLTDPFLEVASREAQDLTRAERLFLVREFFSFNPGTMSADLPRLEQLRRMRGTRAPGPGDDTALAAWRESDFRDLQVLFHLAWSGRLLRARPSVARLIEKGRGYDQGDLEELLAVQRAFLAEVVAQYAAAAREGTIEISASPSYHPILPLLCDTDSAREASGRLPLPSTPFRHPEDARTHVREARLGFERRFGAAPAGLWPSEGAISDAALRILAEEGVSWAASDEDLLFASLGVAPRDLRERSALLHRPYLGPGGLHLFFRDHELSDRIGFVYSSWDARAAVDDFMERLWAIAEAAGNEERVVAVILDGENAWEFYPDNGEPFLMQLFDRMASSESIQARTFSSIVAEAAAGDRPAGRIDSVRAGSWIRADLTTWIGHPEKNHAWSLLAQARAALGAPDPATPAGRSLMAAEGSDWFWWYGDEHSSAHDADFDRTFRRHLFNAYTLAGKEPPLWAGTPIGGARILKDVTRPTGPVTVTLDGRPTDYFEWLGAGRAEADHGRGTMNRAGRLLSTLYFGSDGERLAVRLDTEPLRAGEALRGLFAVLEFAEPAASKLKIPLAEGATDQGALRAYTDRVAEMVLPLSEVGAAAGTLLAFRVILEDAQGKRLESLPSEGLVTFSVGADPFDWIV